MARAQEILCWAAVENLLAISRINGASATPRAGTDIEPLCATVRDFARNLMLCSESTEAIAAGYLDCQRVAAFVQLMGFLSQAEIATALHTTHRRNNSSRNAPFGGFAVFLLNVCDAVEDANRAVVIESAAVA